MSIFAFTVSLTDMIPLSSAEANFLIHPAPGTMVSASKPFSYPVLRGIFVHPEQPFKIDFIIDGTDRRVVEQQEAAKLIKYFLAVLTIPEEDLWVNLSPYESERIVPKELGGTEVGKELLVQDYLLKQLTSSLLYPDQELGRIYWEKLYKKIYELYGTTDLPLNTFNKVWIVPEKAQIYEWNQSAFIGETRLKVLMDQDYLALQKNEARVKETTQDLSSQKIQEISRVASEITKEVILPEIEREVNEGEHFAPLRQVYHSLMLAIWFKEKLKTHLVTQVYADQKKIGGINLKDPHIKDQIYQQYLMAFQEGVYNFIREDYDAHSKQMVPRKYFSGGFYGGDAALLVQNAIPVPNLAQFQDRLAQVMQGRGFSLTTLLKPIQNLWSAEVAPVPSAVEQRLFKRYQLVEEDMSFSNLTTRQYRRMRRQMLIDHRTRLRELLDQIFAREIKPATLSSQREELKNHMKESISLGDENHLANLLAELEEVQSSQSLNLRKFAIEASESLATVRERIRSARQLSDLSDLRLDPQLLGKKVSLEFRQRITAIEKDRNRGANFLSSTRRQRLITFLEKLQESLAVQLEFEDAILERRDEVVDLLKSLLFSASPERMLDAEGLSIQVAFSSDAVAAQQRLFFALLPELREQLGSLYTATDQVFDQPLQVRFDGGQQTEFHAEAETVLVREGWAEGGMSQENRLDELLETLLEARLYQFESRLRRDFSDPQAEILLDRLSELMYAGIDLTAFLAYYTQADHPNFSDLMKLFRVIQIQQEQVFSRAGINELRSSTLETDPEDELPMGIKEEEVQAQGISETKLRSLALLLPVVGMASFLGMADTADATPVAEGGENFTSDDVRLSLWSDGLTLAELPDISDVVLSVNRPQTPHRSWMSDQVDSQRDPEVRLLGMIMTPQTVFNALTTSDKGYEINQYDLKRLNDNWVGDFTSGTYNQTVEMTTAAFQEMHSDLVVDADIGPKTRAKIRELALAQGFILEKASPPPPPPPPPPGPPPEPAPTPASPGPGAAPLPDSGPGSIVSEETPLEETVRIDDVESGEPTRGLDSSGFEELARIATDLSSQAEGVYSSEADEPRGESFSRGIFSGVDVSLGLEWLKGTEVTGTVSVSSKGFGGEDSRYSGSVELESDILGGGDFRDLTLEDPIMLLDYTFRPFSDFQISGKGVNFDVWGVGASYSWDVSKGLNIAPDLTYWFGGGAEAIEGVLGVSVDLGGKFSLEGEGLYASFQEDSGPKVEDVGWSLRLGYDEMLNLFYSGNLDNQEWFDYLQRISFTDSWRAGVGLELGGASVDVFYWDGEDLGDGVGVTVGLSAVDLRQSFSTGGSRPRGIFSGVDIGLGLEWLQDTEVTGTVSVSSKGFGGEDSRYSGSVELESDILGGGDFEDLTLEDPIMLLDYTFRPFSDFQISGKGINFDIWGLGLSYSWDVFDRLNIAPDVTYWFGGGAEAIEGVLGVSVDLGGKFSLEGEGLYASFQEDGGPKVEDVGWSLRLGYDEMLSLFYSGNLDNQEWFDYLQRISFTDSWRAGVGLELGGASVDVFYWDGEDLGDGVGVTVGLSAADLRQSFSTGGSRPRGIFSGVDVSLGLEWLKGTEVTGTVSVSSKGFGGEDSRYSGSVELESDILGGGDFEDLTLEKPIVLFDYTYQPFSDFQISGKGVNFDVWGVGASYSLDVSKGLNIAPDLTYWFGGGAEAIEGVLGVSVDLGGKFSLEGEGLYASFQEDGGPKVEDVGWSLRLGYDEMLNLFYSGNLDNQEWFDYLQRISFTDSWRAGVGLELGGASVDVFYWDGEDLGDGVGVTVGLSAVDLRQSFSRWDGSSRFLESYREIERDLPPPAMTREGDWQLRFGQKKTPNKRLEEMLELSGQTYQEVGLSAQDFDMLQQVVSVDYLNNLGLSENTLAELQAFWEGAQYDPNSSYDDKIQAVVLAARKWLNSEIGIKNAYDSSKVPRGLKPRVKRLRQWVRALRYQSGQNLESTSTAFDGELRFALLTYLEIVKGVDVDDSPAKDAALLSPTGGIDLNQTRQAIDVIPTDNSLLLNPTSVVNPSIDLQNFQGFELQILQFAPIPNPAAFLSRLLNPDHADIPQLSLREKTSF